MTTLEQVVSETKGCLHFSVLPIFSFHLEASLLHLNSSYSEGQSSRKVFKLEKKTYSAITYSDYLILYFFHNCVLPILLQIWFILYITSWYQLPHPINFCGQSDILPSGTPLTSSTHILPSWPLQKVCEIFCQWLPPRLLGGWRSGTRTKESDASRFSGFSG